MFTTLTSRFSVPSRPPVPRRWSSARLLAWAYGVGTLIAAATWFVVGDTWWSQPVNLTTFWWALPAVPVLLIAAVLRRGRIVVPLLVPALLWLWLYGGLFLPVPSEGEAEVRVVTFNTFVHAPDTEHVIELVDETAPDVLVLQEVFPDRWSELDRRLADHYETRQWFESEGVGGVALFSRFPMAGEPIVVGEATAASRTTRVVDLHVGDRHLHVVPVHLISPCPSCGTSMLERLELEGAGRRAEISEVLDVLDDDVPTVVAGDFNSNDRSDPYRTLVEAGFADPHRDAGSGPGFTWPNDHSIVGPVLRIDWVMMRGLEAVDAYVADGRTSDHRPVVVDLRFGGEQ